MGHQAQIGGGHLVAHGGDGRGVFQDAGDGAAGNVADAAVGDHEVAAILHDLEVDVEAGAGLAGGDLGREGDIIAELCAEGADNPLGDHEVVGGLHGGDGQELDLVLLEDLAVGGEVADLGVAVLDLSAGLGDEVHAAAAELVEVCEGRRLVVALLVGGLVEVVVLGHDVVLELSHGVELHAGALGERATCAAQGLVGCRVQGGALLVEEGGEHAQGGNLGKGVYEGGGVAGHHIKVAVAGLDRRREEA